MFYCDATEVARPGEENVLAVRVENSKQPGSADNPGRFRAPPATMFDPMIAPIQPYGIRGVTWCQG